MPQHVLLGANPKEILQAVQLGLEAAGHVVRVVSDVEGVIGAARSKGVDLVIVAEPLAGGTGSDVCLILQDIPGGHAPLLYVGDLLVPGADAFAPPGDPGRILEQANTLLEGAELIDSLGDMQKPSPAPPPPEPPRAAAPPAAPAKAKAPDPEDPPKTRKTPAVKANGAGKNAAREAFDGLLKKVREADYFEILGVAADASGEEIRAAHEAIHASLAEIGSAVPPPQLEEAKAAVDEARDVLSEPALRAAYTRNRP